MNPKVSIIVPIYNAEKYIKKCIDSIINQTLEDIEIILIDDGSKDNSKKIIEEYAQLDKRIIIINQENRGPSIARNKGIKLANGEYIGFVDIDDYIETNMYEELYKIASSSNIQIAMCSYKEIHLYNQTEIVVSPNIKEKKVCKEEEIREKIISTFTSCENYGFYCLWNKIYNRKWILQSQILMDEKRNHGEDWWFNICLFSQLESYIYINKVLYNYIHINNTSLMLKYRENQFDLFLDGRLKLKSIVPQEFINTKELNKRFIYECSSYIIRTFSEIKNKYRRKNLIFNVLQNDELISSFNNTNDLPLYLRIIGFLVSHKFIRTSYILYSMLSKII